MSSASQPYVARYTPMQQGTPVESVPIQGSTTQPFFPPVCLKYHWDPTKIYERTVPVGQVALPQGPRPYTRVCLEYRTSAPEQAAPNTPKDLVFPMGGEVYPPDRYLRAVDDESLLRRLDRPLGTCDPEQYVPPFQGDMFVDRMMVPKSARPPSRFVEELSMPAALMRVGPYDCRAAADQINWDRSPRLFNNATKQDRYRAPASVEPPRQNIWAQKENRCAGS
jgi:hypothetical protein